MDLPASSLLHFTSAFVDVYSCPSSLRVNANQTTWERDYHFGTSPSASSRVRVGLFMPVAQAAGIGVILVNRL
jgi:hypothetical protein